MNKHIDQRTGKLRDGNKYNWELNVRYSKIITSEQCVISIAWNVQQDVAKKGT